MHHCIWSIHIQKNRRQASSCIQLQLKTKVHITIKSPNAYIHVHVPVIFPLYALHKVRTSKNVNTMYKKQVHFTLPLLKLRFCLICSCRFFLSTSIVMPWQPTGRWTTTRTSAAFPRSFSARPRPTSYSSDTMAIYTPTFASGSDWRRRRRRDSSNRLSQLLTTATRTGWCFVISNLGNSSSRTKKGIIIILIFVSPAKHSSI